MRLYDLITAAIENDGFLFIGVLGDKGLGKSVLGLNLVYDVLKDWNKTLKHIIFTLTDFTNLCYRDDAVRHVDDRIKIVLWDDFALHTSSYGFTKKGMRDLLIDFVEEFETVREEIAVLVVTAATWDMIPPKLRDSAHVFIQMRKRGVGDVFVKKRSWLFLKKEYKKIGDIKTRKIPDEVYSKYRELKRRAVTIKQKTNLIKMKEKAKKLAEELTTEEWSDKELLSAYGMVDIHGNWTEFGKMVKKYYEESICSTINKNGIEDFSLREIFTKSISKRKFAMLLRSYGIKGNEANFYRAYDEIAEKLKAGGGNGRHA